MVGSEAALERWRWDLSGYLVVRAALAIRAGNLSGPDDALQTRSIQSLYTIVIVQHIYWVHDDTLGGPDRECKRERC